MNSYENVGAGSKATARGPRGDFGLTLRIALVTFLPAVFFAFSQYVLAAPGDGPQCCGVCINTNCFGCTSLGILGWAKIPNDNYYMACTDSAGEGDTCTTEKVVCWDSGPGYKLFTDNTCKTNNESNGQFILKRDGCSLTDSTSSLCRVEYFIERPNGVASNEGEGQGSHPEG